MIRQPYTETREKIVADCVQEVAAELRLVDLADYVAFIRLERFANIADLVASAAELYFMPGTLAFGHGAESRVDWDSEPVVSLDMRLTVDGATVYFRLGLRAAHAEVDVTYVSFDAPSPDPAENTRFLERALERARIRPLAVSVSGWNGASVAG